MPTQQKILKLAIPLMIDLLTGPTKKISEESTLQLWTWCAGRIPAVLARLCRWLDQSCSEDSMKNLGTSLTVQILGEICKIYCHFPPFFRFINQLTIPPP